MRIILFIFILFVSCQSWAQDRVQWTVGLDADQQKISFTAQMEDGWHIYSQFTDESVGPVATRFSIEEGEVIRLKGDVIEPTPITAFDENFGGEVMYFEDQVTFEQALKVKSVGTVTGTVTYMVCNAEMCLPPVDVNFEIEIKE